MVFTPDNGILGLGCGAGSVVRVGFGVCVGCEVWVGMWSLCGVWCLDV